MKYLNLFAFMMVFSTVIFDSMIGKTKYSDSIAFSGAMIMLGYAANKIKNNYV